MRIPVVILCGGISERMYPITSSTPKCMVDVLNKPLLHWIIKFYELELISSEIILASYGKTSGMITKYLETVRYNVPISVIVEDYDYGTGGGIKNALSVRGDLEDFLVLKGDSIGELKLDELLDSPNDKGFIGLVTSSDYWQDKYVTEDGSVTAITNSKLGNESARVYRLSRKWFNLYSPDWNEFSLETVLKIAVRFDDLKYKFMGEGKIISISSYEAILDASNLVRDLTFRDKILGLERLK